GWTLASIQRGLAAMSRVTEILDAPGSSADWGSAGAISGPPQMKKNASNQPPTSLPSWGRAGAISGPPPMKKNASKQLPTTLPSGPDVRPEESAGRPLPGGPIEFRQLTFAYDDRGPALRDVSFTVPAGAVVAVVGPTGSGKSTLGTLLCRLYEPPRGTVWLRGPRRRPPPPRPLRPPVGARPPQLFPLPPPPPA